MKASQAGLKEVVDLLLRHAAYLKKKKKKLKKDRQKAKKLEAKAEAVGDD